MYFRDFVNKIATFQHSDLSKFSGSKLFLIGFKTTNTAGNCPPPNTYLFLYTLKYLGK